MRIARIGSGLGEIISGARQSIRTNTDNRLASGHSQHPV
jgi:hypothetical protein